MVYNPAILYKQIRTSQYTNVPSSFCRASSLVSDFCHFCRASVRLHRKNEEMGTKTVTQLHCQTQSLSNCLFFSLSFYYSFACPPSPTSWACCSHSCINLSSYYSFTINYLTSFLLCSSFLPFSFSPVSLILHTVYVTFVFYTRLRFLVMPCFCVTSSLVFRFIGLLRWCFPSVLFCF